jgi:hypothetical protein
MFNVFVNTMQLARQVNDKLYWAGAGDPARTEQIAMLMLEDGAFSVFNSYRQAHHQRG